MSGRRRRRVVGLGAAAGTFFVLGMTPLAAPPAAHADFDDLIVQPIIDAISDVSSLVDSSFTGAFDSGLDIDSLLAPALAAVGSLDPANVLDSADSLTALDGALTNLYQALIYDPVQEIGQLWAGSPLGETLDPLINAPFAAVTGHELIDDNGFAGWLFGDDGSDSATAGAAAAGVDPAASTSATVPLQMTAVTEPLVDTSVGGGRDVPVLVDTGSAGLVLPWYDIGLQDIGFPTGLGIGAYSGGLDYFYLTVPTTVDFGNDVITSPTDVNLVLFTFPDSLADLFTYPTSLHEFLAPSGAEGVLGIGPNATGPGPSIPIDDLPGALSHGVLIDEHNGVLQFGDNPLGSDAVSVNGAPMADLKVSIDGGTPHSVHGVIDSGGVYGTMPSSVLGTGQTSGAVPDGTEIAVYDQDGHLLYSYTASGGNGPSITSGDSMNTGWFPFDQRPVYISNSPSGAGTTIFGEPY